MEKTRLEIEYFPLNEPQKATLARIKKLADSAHFIDLQFRDSGKFKVIQADFLRQILKQII